jgi:hypothetical protein
VKALNSSSLFLADLVLSRINQLCFNRILYSVCCITVFSFPLFMADLSWVDISLLPLGVYDRFNISVYMDMLKMQWPYSSKKPSSLFISICWIIYIFHIKKLNIGLPDRARISYFLTFIWFPTVETGLWDEIPNCWRGELFAGSYLTKFLNKLSYTTVKPIKLHLVYPTLIGWII